MPDHQEPDANARDALSHEPACAPAGRPTRGLEIDRCVCHDLRFAEVKAQLGGRPTTLDAIARRFGCGASCGTCRPYLARMLRTGETVFDEIILDVILDVE